MASMDAKLRRLHGQKLNETLHRGHINRWIEDYARAFPDIDADQLRGIIFDEVDFESYDTPTDFMDDIVARRHSDFYEWWVRERQTPTDLKEEIAHYEEQGKQEAVRYTDRKMAELLTVSREDVVKIADKVVELCLKNPIYERFIGQMLEIENKILEAGGFWSGDSHCDKPFGWSLDEIPDLTGGHINHMVKSGIVADPREKGYKSNQYTYYRLQDPAQVSMGLEKLQDLRESAEAEIEAAQASTYLEQFQVSDEDIERFKEILSENDGLEYWFDAVNPKIIGMVKQKQAVLISLSSTEDKHGNKNRTHSLLWGEPGTGKSKLAWIAAILGGGWASMRTSKVGLTADASGGDLTKGLLTLHHLGAVGIDELDKFSADDQSGCLDSMEEGVNPVNAGKFVGTMLPAETIIVATANELKKLRPELVDRFDFVIHCPKPSQEEAMDISEDIIEYWDRPKGKQTKDLGKFLKWVREFDPDIPQTVREQAKVIVAEFIQLVDERRPRRLESIMRVAKAIARLNHRDVELKDVKRALKLIRNNKREAN